MNPIGFAPAANNAPRGVNHKEQYARDIQYLTELKLKYLQVQLKPTDGPPALRAYLNIKNGKDKGLIPDDVYRPQELDRLKRIIDPIYMIGAKKILEPELAEHRTELERKIRLTSDPETLEATKALHEKATRTITQVSKVTSIDDFSKPEFANARQEFDMLLNSLTREK